jgi:hypothetical protein
MSAFHVGISESAVIIVQGASATADVISDQIRESIREATQEARIGTREAREIQQSIRRAEKRVSDAKEQLDAARTADQRGGAAQELMGAEAELAALRGVLQSGGRVTVHTTEQPPMLPRDMVPPQIVDISIGFFIMCAVMVIGWPIARAFGRRLEHRGIGTSGGATAEQLQRIEQAVEAMAIEVERISESQRFMAKLQQSSGDGRAAIPVGERR